MSTIVKKISIGGETATYVELGKGKPTIVILGWLASLEHFPYITLKKFENTYLKSNKLIFLHLSNFGLSSISNKPMGINNYTTQLYEFIKTKKYKKINLIAHSAGGRHAINFCITHPKMVKKLVLLATAGFTPKTAKKNPTCKS